VQGKAIQSRSPDNPRSGVETAVLVCTWSLRNSANHPRLRARALGSVLASVYPSWTQGVGGHTLVPHHIESQHFDLSRARLTNAGSDRSSTRFPDRRHHR